MRATWISSLNTAKIAGTLGSALVYLASAIITLASCGQSLVRVCRLSGSSLASTTSEHPRWIESRTHQPFPQRGQRTVSLFTTDLKGGGYSAMGGDEVFVPSGTRGHLRIQVQRAAGLQVLVYRQPGRSAGPLKTFAPTRDDETFTST